MARRSDHTRNELTELVLNATSALIAEKGVEGLTARQIAAEIGYSPGTLYNIFENLDDLLLHVAGQTLERMLAEASKLPGEGGDPRTALRRLAVFYFRFTRKNDHLWRLVIERRWPDRTRIPAWYMMKVMSVLGVVEQVVAPMFAEHEGDLRRRTALTLFASMQGICSVAQSSSLISIPERMAIAMADQLIEYMVTGLERRERRPERSRPRLVPVG
jgi:AcrR family transcriptional regulator